MDELIDARIRDLLAVLSPGMSEGNTAVLSEITLLLLVILTAFVANFIAKRIILRLVQKVIAKTEITWDDVLVEHRVFDKLSQLAPALVFYVFSGIIFPSLEVKDGIRHAAIAYMIVVVASAVNALLSAIVVIYDTFQLSKSRPIKSYVGLVKAMVSVITAILVISTLTDRSPWGFLSGLAAMAGVIMFVFKDSIMGLVGSIQLTAYRMVEVGDWIEVPKYGVDGDVIEISLNIIRVRNFDKTISTFPTYALMSETFRNWRFMSESGGRRIKRALRLDMTSVKFLHGPLRERIEDIDLLKGYLADKAAEIEADAKERGVSIEHPVNARKLTNLGTFRAYVVAYLRNHKKIHQDMTFLVRQLHPSAEGIGLEVYVFTNDTVWANYESIQADIFEHLLAVLPEFELRVFQNPSGADMRMLGRGD